MSFWFSTRRNKKVYFYFYSSISFKGSTTSNWGTSWEIKKCFPRFKGKHRTKTYFLPLTLSLRRGKLRILDFVNRIIVKNKLNLQFPFFFAYFFCLALSYLGILSILRNFKILLSFILDKSKWSPIQFDQPRWMVASGNATVGENEPIGRRGIVTWLEQ